MKRLVIQSLVALFFIAFSIQISAASETGCIKTLKTRTGTVYAGGPATVTLKPGGNSITVKMTKRGGKAQTIINIYVNNQRKAFIQFTNGKYTSTKSKTVSGVKNKNVRIEIINQSVGNKFEYTLKVTGNSGTDNLGSRSGNLAGQVQQTTSFDKPCKNRIRITLNRTGGSARGNVYIKKNGRTIFDEVLDKNETRITRTLPNASGGNYEILVKNVSTGNFLRYTATAVQID